MAKARDWSKARKPHAGQLLDEQKADALTAAWLKRQGITDLNNPKRGISKPKTKQA